MTPQNRNYKNRETYAFPDVSQTTIHEIITTQSSTEKLVKFAEEIGRALTKPKEGDKKKLATSQIRAIFGEVRRIEGKWHGGTAEEKELANRQLILLKPKMAYRKEKEKNLSVQRLADVLTMAIDEVNGDMKNFTRFVEFFEAILAYHKAYGGN